MTIITSASVLDSTKKILGLGREYTAFDLDIAFHIKSVCMTLSQIGVYVNILADVSNSETTWSDVFPNINDLEAVKSYMALKVRMLFDTPTIGVVGDAIKRQLDELEWRIMLEAEKYKEQ